MAEKPVRIVLVDDSPLALAVIRRMLAAAPGIEILGTARDGREGLALVEKVRPDVLCTDFDMPVMNGLELTREVMARCPCPILVISSAVGASNPERVFSLLQAGAVDVFLKPRGGTGTTGEAADLVAKIRLVARVPVIRRRGSAAPEGGAPTAGSLPRVPGTPGVGSFRLPSSGVPAGILAIGASTGGPQALQAILPALPADFPVPVLCVQHISHGFLRGLIDWLAGQSRVPLRTAVDGETPRPGTVYFPQEDTHLVLDRQGRLQASREPPVDGHRPSATVTFRSVAERYGRAAVAVLLSGMGRDGGAGMAEVLRAGGVTVAQDEASCVVWGMPRAAVELGVARLVLPPSEIARLLVEAIRPRPG